jgi:hypothetical protein
VKLRGSAIEKTAVVHSLVKWSAENQELNGVQDLKMQMFHDGKLQRTLRCTCRGGRSGRDSRGSAELADK